MWWLFTGVLSGLIWTWVSWRRRWGEWSDGELRRFGGIHAFWSERYSRFLFRNLMLKEAFVGVPFSKEYRFELKREDGPDRFFKWTGLSVERQIGASTLDRLIYIGDDEGHLANRLVSNQNAQQLVVDLFTERLAGCKLRRIRSAQGRLWLELGRTDFADDDEVRSQMLRAAHQLMPMLEGLAKVLNMVGMPDVGQKRKDPFVLPSILMLATSSGLAVAGFATFLLAGADQTGVLTLERGRLLGMAGLMALTLWLFLLGLHTLLMRGSSRFHLILAELFLTGGTGLLLLSLAFLGHINRSLDTSDPKMLMLTIQGKEIRDGWKRSTSYYLVTVHPSEPHSKMKWPIGHDLYTGVNMGDVLEFSLFEGYLAIPWVKRIGLRSGAQPKDLSPIAPLPPEDQEIEPVSQAP